ncbi:MAG: DUF1365 domain-containing protein [Blastocatellia bacterium]|nr:DUF1365 domain-containing protein [Blastocatellia bacterium]
MRSRLYECSIMHERLCPIRYGFRHRAFIFCLDLDEIPSLAKRLWLLSNNRLGVFSFYDRDHLSFGKSSVRQAIESYALAHGVDVSGCRIELVTHLRTLGYIFNPVSFYFCSDLTGQPVCAVAEVSNTFGEMKPYFLGKETLEDGLFRLQVAKHFYVSPFIPMDSVFEFRLRPPAERIHLAVDCYVDSKPLLVAAMWGERRSLDDATLCFYAIRFPFITLKVIGLIHWHALRLYLRRLPFYRKNSHLDLQRGFYGKKSR